MRGGKNDWHKFKSYLYLSLKTLFANFCLVVIMLVGSYFYFGEGQIYLWINQYQSTEVFKHFFGPLNEFYKFYKDTVRLVAGEEVFYRAWCLIPLKIGLNFRFKNINLALYTSWIIMFVGTYYWATTHTVLWQPVFISGLVWGWLMIKTQSIWPPLFTHAFADILIFLAINVAAWYGIIVR